jgi:hypothetical protein
MSATLRGLLRSDHPRLFNPDGRGGETRFSGVSPVSPWVYLSTSRSLAAKPRAVTRAERNFCAQRLECSSKFAALNLQVSEYTDSTGRNPACLPHVRAQL